MTPIYGRFLYFWAQSRPYPTTNLSGISKPVIYSSTGIIFVVGVIAACVLYGGKIPAFAEDTQEQYDSSQSSYGQLLEPEGDTSGILQFGGQIIEEEASDSTEASLAAANS